MIPLKSGFILVKDDMQTFPMRLEIKARLCFCFLKLRFFQPIFGEAAPVGVLGVIHQLIGGLMFLWGHAVTGCLLFARVRSYSV